MTFLERFWSRVDRRGDDECWLWKGGHTPLGYGAIWRDGRNHGAHRIALEIALGRPLCEGYFACHHCDNPGCVNAKHLFEGTHGDNIRDMHRKGRNPAWTPPSPECLPRGEQHWNAVINDESVRAIRARLASGESQRSVARAFQMCPSSISKLANGHTWAHVS